MPCLTPHRYQLSTTVPVSRMPMPPVSVVRTANHHSPAVQRIRTLALNPIVHRQNRACTLCCCTAIGNLFYLTLTTETADREDCRRHAWRTAPPIRIETRSTACGTGYKIDCRNGSRTTAVQSRCGKIPNGTASAQLPIMMGRIKPRTRYSQIADANAHATVCVPSPKGDRPAVHPQPPEQRLTHVKKKPAINHQPPSVKWRYNLKGHRPAAAAPAQARASWRMNCTRIPVDRSPHVQANNFDRE